MTVRPSCLMVACGLWLVQRLWLLGHIALALQRPSDAKGYFTRLVEQHTRSHHVREARQQLAMATRLCKGQGA